VQLFFVELTVTLISSPSGPTYQAATWITLECSATSGSGLYSYKWKVSCASTGVLVYESNLGASTTFRIKSTPTVCYDKVECIAEDRVLSLTGTGTMTISSVSGIPQKKFLDILIYFDI